MTQTYEFEDFFDINFEKAIQFGYPKPREDLVQEIKHDFEIFINHTEMGRSFAPQLLEAINGNEEKNGIDKIKLTEFTEEAIKRFNIYENTPANWSHNTVNGEDVVFISFNSNVLNQPNNSQYNYVNIEGNPPSVFSYRNFFT
jgi:hypothetical protein